MALSLKDFKQYLLANFDSFIDNEALDTYIEFILSYSLASSDYSEKHHVIPVAYYKNKYECKSRHEALKFANSDVNNFQISLLYKDHCKAHYLLYFCTRGFLKYANAETVNYMFSVYPALTKPQGSQKLFEYNGHDFECLQQYMEELRESSDSRFWTQYEIDFLNQHYAKNGVQYCAENLNRKYEQVKSKAQSLGLKVHVFRYSEETKQFLREYYPKYGMRYCSEKLNIPMDRIKDLASCLGLKMDKWWTEAELAFLVDNYNKLGYKECARQLDRTDGSVITKAGKLGLCKDRVYTDEEKEFIRIHYPKEGILYCALALDRSEEAIKRYACTLGVRRPPQGSVIYCPELDRQFNSIREASIQLNMSDGGICGVVNGRLKSYKNLHFIKGTKEDYYNEKRQSKN